MLIQEAVHLFLLYVQSERRMSLHTTTAYMSDLSQFKNYLKTNFDKENIKDIVALHIRTWMMELNAAGMNNSTIRRKHSTLKSFFNRQKEIGIIESNPMQNVAVPKLKKRLPVFLEKEQTERLFDSTLFSDDFQGHTDKLIFEILFQTGIRRSELTGLKESDISFYYKQIKVLGKRNKERLIPISEDLLNLIKEYLKLKKEFFDFYTDKLLILKSGKPVGVQYVYRTVKKYLQRITTLDKKSPHVMRHTFATQLLNNGANLNAVKELLGHSSLAATQIYTSTNIQQLQKVYRKAHPKN